MKMECCFGIIPNGIMWSSVGASRGPHCIVLYFVKTKVVNKVLYGLGCKLDSCQADRLWLALKESWCQSALTNITMFSLYFYISYFHSGCYCGRRIKHIKLYIKANLIDSFNHFE